jgi:sec-independent protein translocase protein TatB
MFDIGWTEMLVIAVVMIVIVGPKDLPRMLRTFGRTTSKLRAMAGDFRKQFDDALKEAELDDVRKSVESVRGLNPASQIKKHLSPMEKAAADVRAGVDAAMKPKPKAPEPAAATPQPAEPLKTGAAATPGEAAQPAVAAAASAKPAAKAAAPAKPAAPKKAAPKKQTVSGAKP